MGFNSTRRHPPVPLLITGVCGGLKENREWHYQEVWIIGVGVALLREECHCEDRL